VNESSDVIQRNADIHADSFTTLQELQHELSELGFSYGNVIGQASIFAPILIAAGPAAKGLMMAIHGLSLAKIVLTGVYGTLTVVATAAWTAMTGPVGLAVIAIAALVAAGVLLWKNWDKIKAIAMDVFGWVGDKIDSMVDGAKVAIDRLIGFFSDLPGQIMSAMAGLANILTMPYRIAFDAFRNFANMLLEVWNGLEFTFPEVNLSIPAIKAFGKTLFGGVDMGFGPWIFGTPDIPLIPALPSFASGGIMPGRPGEAGLAIIHGGERIQTPTQQMTGGVGSSEMHFHFPNYIGDRQELLRWVQNGIQRLQDRGAVARSVTR